MAESNPWRDKYRRALAQQEQLEQTLAAQQSILHRAIINLCAAAEGTDSKLDERLQAIISSVKRNDVAGFDRMLKSLPRVTEEAESRQQKHWQELAKTMAAIANQVQAQSPDADIKPAVKHFKKQLPKSLPLIPSTVKRYLSEISDIQQQALALAPQQRSGLFGKLFKDKSEGNSEANSESNKEPIQKNNRDKHQEETERLNTNNASLVENSEGEIIEGEVLAYKRERQIPEALLEEHYQQEEKSTEIPGRVSVILVELLDHFKTVPASEAKATKARSRIEKGLRWFELAPALEDIRDFVLQAYIGADTEYQQYLEHLYGELSEVLAALGVSIETEQRVRKAGDSLHDNVNEGMEEFKQSLSKHKDIVSLKQAVDKNLTHLQTALMNFKQETKEKADSESLANQLQDLANKVKQMEKNDEEVRQKLEEEKNKALTDSLTGLPNREAWNQHSHQEMLRWQRYKNPLTLAVLDIDFFKKINDNYGHQTGDKVLKIVSAAVAKRLRSVDFIARYGGEEFVVLLPETDQESALLMLNRIREGLANAPFKYKDQKINITVSIGISEFKDGDTTETVFEKADQALYEAKETGRNKCCISE